MGPADLLRIMSYVVLAVGIALMAYLISQGYFFPGVGALIGGTFLFALGLAVSMIAENAQARAQRAARPKLKL